MKPLISKYQCEHCNFRTNRVTNFTNHVNAVHLGVRAYKCDTCDKTFTQLSHKNMHNKRVHLDLRPLSCKYCPMKFLAKEQIVLHEKAVHKSLTSDPEFKCDICEFKTHYKVSLKGHIERRHGQQPKRFACTDCERDFSSSSTRNDHIKKFHVNNN